MSSRIKDLTVLEFQNLISDTIRATIEELIEDILALSSEEN
jgi:hypothetical protein